MVINVARVFGIGMVIGLGMFWCLNSVSAATGINRKINFQGKVVNTDGTNVTDGNHNFIFNIYSVSSAGTSIWSEVWNTVPVSSGIFSVDLGTQSTFPPTVDFNTDNLYLSLSFEGDAEMTPRIRMAAVPYAINAEKVSGLTVTNTTGSLTIGNGKLIIFGDSFVTTGIGISLDQNLSMGSTVVFAGLSIGGSVAFTNLPIGTGTSVLFVGAGGKLVQGTLPVYTANNGLSLAGSVIGLGGTLTKNTEVGVSSFSLMFTNSSNILTIGASGFVGVGTTNPLYKFHLVGDALISTRLGIGATNILYTLNVGGTVNSADLFSSGHISIANTSGLYALNVTGSALVSTKLGIGATGTKAFNVLSDASIGTNLAVGGSLALTSLPVGIGTSVLYIGTDGNIVQGTLPVINIANSKVIILSPEFAGAALSADGSGTTSVSMTSDNTLNAVGVGWKNYYELTSANASLQDYSVIVRITLPSDFDTWESGSCPGSTCALEMAYQTGLGTVADNAISFIISNDTDTPATAVCTVGSTASATWGLSGCTAAILNDGVAPEWDLAGETAVVRIKMAAKNTSNAVTRMGDIILRYKSKF